MKQKKVKDFNKCCKLYIAELWKKFPDILWYQSNCPTCGHFVGLTYSSPEYIANTLKEWKI